MTHPGGKASHFLAALEDKEVAACGEFAFHSWPPHRATWQLSDIVLTVQAIFQKCFKTVPQSARMAPQIHQRRSSARRAIICDWHGAAPSIFPRTETDTALSVSIISAPHPSVSCCSLTNSDSMRPLPLLFLRARQRRRGNLPLIVSHFPLSEFKPGQRMDG